MNKHAPIVIKLLRLSLYFLLSKLDTKKKTPIHIPLQSSHLMVMLTLINLFIPLKWKLNELLQFKTLLDNKTHLSGASS